MQLSMLRPMSIDDRGALPDDIATLKAMVIAGGRMRDRSSSSPLPRCAATSSALIGARCQAARSARAAAGRARGERGAGYSSSRDQRAGGQQGQAAAQARAPAAARAFAARARGAFRAVRVPGLRWGLAQAGRGHHRDAGTRAAQWKVIQHVREKFSCRACEAITQAPAPSHPIARGRAGPELLAQVLFAKYGPSAAQPAERHLRQRRHRSRHLDAGRLGRRLRGDADAAGRRDREHVFAAERIHADDTTGAGARKRQDAHRPAVDLCARRQAVRRPRGAGGDVLLLARSRRRAPGGAPGRLQRPHAGRRLCRLQRALQQAAGRADHRGRLLGARAAQVLRTGRLTRRRSPSRPCGASTNCSPSSARSTASPPEQRPPSATSAAARWSRRSRPGCASRRQALLQQPGRQGHRLQPEAMGRASRFLDDGRICMSNNAAERAVRGIAVGRRNWTFAGSDGGGRRAAAIYTLIETAKLNDIDPAPGSPTCSPACRSSRQAHRRAAALELEDERRSKAPPLSQGLLRGLHRTLTAAVHAT